MRTLWPSVLALNTLRPTAAGERCQPSLPAAVFLGLLDYAEAFIFEASNVSA